MIGSRHLVLVDFDWDDADLVPVLLRRPDISVRLVAGQRAEDPGLRLAELCDVPRTVDLTDLTREIFSLALVSDKSPRRAQVESLLRAMGTPSQSPQAFLDERASDRPAPETPGEAFDFGAALQLQSAVLDDVFGDLEDSPRVEPRPNGVPGHRGWLSTAEFLRRVEEAAARHEQSGHPLALDRLDLPLSAPAGDHYAERLPDRVRESDSICQPSPLRILLLTGTSRERFAFMRSRLLADWEQAWLASGNPHPVPELQGQRVELTRGGGAAAFVARARRWSEPQAS